MENKKPDFQNTEIAFKQWSDVELYRAWTLFKSIGIKPVVNFGPGLVTTALKIGLPVRGLLRSTVFRQFCGGETLELCRETMDKLKKGHVYTILDYAVEGEKAENGFDAACEEVLKTISSTINNPAVPFCVFKLTALARFELLEYVSKNGFSSMPPEIHAEWSKVETRVQQICQKAVDAGKMVMIDAEESWIQGAIDHVAHKMMKKHNQKDARVFATIQMYLTNGLTQVENLLALSSKEGWIPGIKLVRGAYMEKERLRAEQNSLPSPIQPDKIATDRAYDQALERIIQKNQDFKLCVGTHNASSIETSLKLMEKAQILGTDPKVWFAQLFGMSDDLTFNLAHAGYLAAKYVPFGPIDAVLPYLFRRAHENSSIAGQSGRELKLIERELKRRRA